MVFMQPPSKKWRRFKILKKLTFLQMFFGKIKNFKTLSLKLIKNMGRGFTSLKVWNKIHHSSRNYGTSNLLFRFTAFCIGQPNQNQNKIAVISKVPNIESYPRIKLNLKVSVPVHVKMVVLFRCFRKLVKSAF